MQGIIVKARSKVWKGELPEGQKHWSIFQNTNLRYCQGSPEIQRDLSDPVKVMSLVTDPNRESGTSFWMLQYSIWSCVGMVRKLG